MEQEVIDLMKLRPDVLLQPPLLGTKQILGSYALIKCPSREGVLHILCFSPCHHLTSFQTLNIISRGKTLYTKPLHLIIQTFVGQVFDLWYVTTV